VVKMKTRRRGIAVGGVSLVVCLLFDPAAGVFSKQVLAGLVIDENGQTEWHRCDPPCPPEAE
jgi:hypothetical protein